MANKAYLVEETTGEINEVPVENVDKNWYRRPSNYQLGQFDKDFETKREASMTVPDQSYTVREILDKFTRGLPIDEKRSGSYDEITEFSENDPENAIDIVDVQEQLTAVNQRIKDLSAAKASQTPKKEKLPDNEQLNANSEKSTNNDVS